MDELRYEIKEYNVDLTIYEQGGQLAIAKSLDCRHLALLLEGLWLRYAAKFDPFLS